MIAVAVTGVSGRTGRRLLGLLERDARVERVVGVDVREPPPPRKPGFHALDVSGGAAGLEAAFEGVDVLVHLAGLSQPVPDEGVMARVNVEGMRGVLDAASATGVGRVVHLSTAFAYGARPGNPVPLTEDAPLRPNRGFPFAVHKAETERMLAEWRDEHPGVATAVLRPPFVLGGGTNGGTPRGTNGAVRALVLGRLPVRVRGAAPEVQYLHVDDLASALAFTVFSDVQGAFNVAPPGWLSHEDAARLAGRSRWAPRVPVSTDAAERTVRRLWRAGVGDVPPGMVPLLVHPCVVSGDRLEAAGWRPRHTNEEALLACLEEARVNPGTSRSRRPSRR